MADGDLQALSQELRAAVARIQRLSDDHWYVLDPICGAMDDGAWAGPAGRRFGSSVRSERVVLRGQLTQAVQSAKAKLADLPKLP
jgi:hypothetical protein